MIYSSVMVLNVGNYSCQAKSISTSCQANIVFLYTTNICLLEVHCFLKVEMKCLQTRLYETKKSSGAPVFGLRVRVSIPFTVSLIFQMSPWVASQEFATLGDSWNSSYFTAPFGCLVEDGDCHCHCDLGIPRCDGSIFFLCPGQSWINQSQSIWFRLAGQCNVWSLKQAEEVCVDLLDQGNHKSPSHKSSSSINGSLYYSVELEIVFFFLDYVGWIVNFVIQHKSIKGFNLESLVAENSYVLMFPKWNLVH